MSILAVFPGQGSQKIGMGADIYEKFACAREVFHEVDDAISYKLSDLIFNGNEEELKQTQNAQPAIMTVSMAFVQVLKLEFGIDISDKASFFAGHSLGEYSALCATGVISLSDTARILRIRGTAMSEACPNEGAMAAIIGLNISAVESITKKINADNAVVQIGNDNSPRQIIVSGHKSAVEQAMALAQEAGAKRTIKLEVSGPFHSVLMEKAIEPLKDVLESVEFKNPIKPIITNVTAKAENNNLKSLLIEQLTSRVRWTETILFAKDNGVTKCVEIGPGRVLTGLIKQITNDIETVNVNSAESLSL
ncbi:MAG: ACP S-malonyltransferase [Alphaproteobacteria bacterium]|nr:ACP S-malonyltransferase [Alphaproteobacteria bacterium]